MKTMANMLIAVIALNLMVSAAFADFSQIEVEYDLKGNESAAFFHAWGGGPINGTIFAQTVEGGWWQARVGASYSPLPNISIGTAVGAEQGGFRGASTVMATYGRFSVSAIHEYGHSGPWHKDKLMYDLSKRLAVGYVDQSYCGHGGTARYQLDGSTAVNYSLFERGGQLLSVARNIKF